jgi:protocatechuate 3,4-dioxygenase beta subunit
MIEHHLRSALIGAIVLLVVSCQGRTGSVEPIAPSSQESVACEPTPPDQLGPFYLPGAPERPSVGEGHLLSGVVRSASDCALIPDAQIEFWQVGPDGEYDDAHRATMFSEEDGTYRFESNFPPAYSGRPPHIHLRVSKVGFKILVTQYYPDEGQTSGSLDLVLVPGE